MVLNQIAFFFVTNLKDPELITDEFHAYNTIGREMKPTIINYSEQFVGGNTHKHNRRVLVFVQTGMVRATPHLLEER